jgi:CRISPR-associated protein Cst2
MQTQMALPETDLDSDTEIEATDSDTTQGEQEKQQTSQMLFSRPTRSGTYAIATVLQPWRIGLNTVDYTYPKPDQRAERYKLALRAYRAMFLRMDGAMTSTRLPHLEKFEGAVVVTSTNEVAPVFSPLEDDYLSKLNRLKGIDKNLADVHPFNDVVEFVEKLKGLESHTPYALTTADDGE